MRELIILNLVYNLERTNMFTTIIIFIIIFVIIWKSSEKEEAEKRKIVDKVDHNERRNILNIMPDTRIQLNALSGVNKMLSLSISEDNILTLFSYSQKSIFVKFQSGKTYTLDIEKMNVYFTFDPAANCRCAEITVGTGVIYIKENTFSTSTQDWDRIFEILSLSGTTHQVDCLSVEARQQAIFAYKRQMQQLRQQQQAMRNFQRIQQNNWNMMNRF